MTEPGGHRLTLLALRATVALSTACVLAQPVLAGGYLSGRFDFLGYHETNADIISTVLLVQAIAATAYLVGGRGSAVPLLITGVQFFATFVQLGMGYSRQLAVHIPLGVLLVILALHVCVWVFRPAARLSRKDRTRKVTHA
ncbi:MAG: hypothetical protein GEU97_12095 [Actinophytocola sp.]|nr:hypothetical protein [Actinophytocola sp.]